MIHRVRVTYADGDVFHFAGVDGEYYIEVSCRPDTDDAERVAELVKGLPGDSILRMRYARRFFDIIAASQPPKTVEFDSV